MYGYGIEQWITFFAIYCFVGWGFESLYVSVEHRKWVNRGFLNGPFLPIYGFGAIIMLFAALPVRDNIALTFLFGMAGATALEYFTGYVMEKMFHVKYWDYTYEPLNLDGYICLGCSLMWGALSVLLVRVVHRPTERLVLQFSDMALRVFDIAFLIYFVWDLVISARQAFDFKKIIDEQIMQNEKVQRMQKRLDVLLAFAEDDRNRIQAKLAESREERQAKAAERRREAERIKAELEALCRDYAERTKRYRARAMHIWKRNPGAVSKRHRLNKEELAALLREYFQR